MKHEFSVVIERDNEGRYVASVPALPGCHTQARSLDELMDRVREAIALCLEAEAEAEETGGLEFVGVQRLSVPARPHVIGKDLDAAYQQMAQDEVREAEALDWIELSRRSKISL